VKGQSEMFKRFVIVLAVMLVVAAHNNITRAGECSDGNIDACWARFYAAGGNPSNESRVYFRIFKACQDGIRIGVAANIVDEEEIYVKQYGSGENPPFRLLTSLTTVPLTHYPGGQSIEWTSEQADSYNGVATVYYMKVVNLGWSELFDSDYIDSVMLASSGYGYSENDSTGIVRSDDFENCKLFTNPPYRPGLSPFVQCVASSNGNLTALFGYYNYTGYDTIIPLGQFNKITRFLLPFPVTYSQPTYLEQGLHYNVVAVNAKTQSFSWKLGGVISTAPASSKPC
jgi:hypothetical protein